MSLRNLLCLGAVILLAGAVSTAQADVPQMINYQGVLTSGGSPVTTEVSVIFAIWDDPTDGDSLWSEQQSITPDANGGFTTLLGSVSSIPDSAFKGDAYLSVRVGADPEMSPRMRLVSVPYSFRDVDWDLIGDVLYTGGEWGIARAGNVLYGIHDSTHVNLGVACTTGATGPSYSYAAVGGGYGNTASETSSTVGGGWSNTASGQFGTVGGGLANTASGGTSTVGGGQHNTASDHDATVGGGVGNTASTRYATVGGGQNNAASGSGATVGGGWDNTASGARATVGGGASNTASGYRATVGGGRSSTASLHDATVGGGRYNRARGYFSVVAGGGEDTEADSNSALGYASAILGGIGNIADGDSSSIGGGSRNTANGNSCTISGGTSNTAEGQMSTVGGGWSNIAGYYATVGGGWSNIAGYYATVGGGQNNTAGWYNATVGGGLGNYASGSSSTVGGGNGNTASGGYSFAAGRRAKAANNGVFAWADDNDLDFPAATESNFTPAAKMFLVRSIGGAVFVSGIDGSGNSNAGVQLAAGGGSWSSLSDRNLKENFEQVDGADVLAKIAALPISTWNYKAQDESIRHIGPMAQDLYAAFGLGEDDRHITTIDADGIALAAIQGLYAKTKELENKDKELETMKAQIAELQALVQQLMDDKE